ncbi:MAG: VWA domain-containing protein [Muribaculaceae bacterium]|nr:VWA domain-containing protein [Muribaculaceae bacterium]
MEEKRNMNEIYNVIILDKSGSMSSIRRQAVGGVNECIGSIKASQTKNPEIKQYVSLVAFCSCELKVIYDTVPVEKVTKMTARDYAPCCCTPLYDAIGNTITRVHKHILDNENAIVNVTIITDGYENASQEFSYKAIKALIESYKNEGWMFAYIGADHDVESVAFDLSIDNALQFEKTEEGTEKMFERFTGAMEHRQAVIAERLCVPMSPAERKKMIKSSNSNFFNK